MSRADLEAKLGTPQMVDLDSNGVGPVDAWAMRFTCGLEVVLWMYKMRPDGSIMTDRVAASSLEIYSNQRDEEHVLFHLPFKISVAWRYDDQSTFVCRTWRLLRQDDNGNRFEMRSFTSRCEAESAARAFEELGHKQTYWVESGEALEGPFKFSWKST